MSDIARVVDVSLKTLVSPLAARATEALLPKPTVERLRLGRQWRRWIDSLEPDVLEDLTHAPAAVKRRLFHAHVTLVEIETHAKCNRVCGFCPNSIVDRRRNQQLADAAMLDRVFDQLGSVGYSGQIKVARYSEPLTNFPYLLERIRQARARVPRAELAIVTNTDYLTRDRLDQLRDAGLNVMYLSLYLRTKERWSVSLARRYTRDVATKLGTPVVRESVSSVSVRGELAYDGVALRSSCHDFGEYGTDRGALMEAYTDTARVGPCREPFETFVIDHDGAVMPCCNLRHDFPEHRGFAVGDLADPRTTIFDVYAGRLAAWRQSMVGVGPKAHPCTTCRQRDLPTKLVSRSTSALWRRLRAIGLERWFAPPAPVGEPSASRELVPLGGLPGGSRVSSPLESLEPATLGRQRERYTSTAR